MFMIGFICYRNKDKTQFNQIRTIINLCPLFKQIHARNILSEARMKGRLTDEDRRALITLIHGHTTHTDN